MNNKELVKEAEGLMNQDDWKRARKNFVKALRREPDSHWLITRIGLTWYEERKYKKALEYSLRALELAPNCPLVLWDLAGCYDMLERDSEAIKIWKKLIRRGIDRVAFGECGEGKRWAESLINDCRYRIANTYLDSNRVSKAQEYFREHLAHRRKGLPSIYTKKEVVQNFQKSQRA